MAKRRSTATYRWRQQIRITARRERRRLSRLDREYDPNRTQHRPNIDKARTLHGKARGSRTIELPAELTLDTQLGAETILKILVDLRNAALVERRKRIILDFHKVQTLAPEVAVLLLAELQRCDAYCSPATNISGTHPTNHKVTELLKEIGFYEALGIRVPPLPKTYQTRTYVRVERGNKSAPKLVDELISCFETELSFASDDRKRLQVALLECIDNVNEHAYSQDPRIPSFYKEWWLVGFADHQDHNVVFVFYDQGLGIPHTVKKKRPSRVLARLAGWNDARWLERAVTKSVSRLHSKRRGHGLLKLRKFIVGIKGDASLRVIANRGDYTTTTRGSNPVELNEGLDGTLIVWSVNGIPDAQRTLTSIDDGESNE